jgi:DNA-binding PadR family transcriptional regulator
MSQVPSLTHLQFLVLSRLRVGAATGRELRKRLEEYSVRKSGPAFYQLMSRMEDAGVVKGWYEQQIVDSQIIRERHYEVTAQGSSAWEKSGEFYRQASEGLSGLEGLAHG